MKPPPFRTDRANLNWILRRAQEIQNGHRSPEAVGTLGTLGGDLAYLQQCADFVIAISALVPTPEQT